HQLGQHTGWIALLDEPPPASGETEARPGQHGAQADTDQEQQRLAQGHRPGQEDAEGGDEDREREPFHGSAQPNTPFSLSRIWLPRPGTCSIGRFGSCDHSAMDSGYSRTFFWPTTSDSANQSVAAQWPVLQKEMVSDFGSGRRSAAILRASSSETKIEVPGLNQRPFSTLTAPWIVPGTCAVGALTLPR